MCADCSRSICDCRCPEAPEDKAAILCVKCDEGIFNEDRYFCGPDGPICYDCLKKMSALEMLEILGEEVSRMKVEED